MKTSVKIVHWVPRILCILAILFISMFALDSFSPGRTLWQNVGALLMHLVPSFVLIALLIVAWKWELTGGIIFIVLGAVASPLIYSLNFQRNHSAGASFMTILIVTLPFIFIGILFIVSHYLKKREGAVYQ